MIEMTDRQEDYLDSLAHDAGFNSVEAAVADVTGQSVSRLKNRGISISQASQTIDALREKLDK